MSRVDPAPHPTEHDPSWMVSRPAFEGPGYATFGPFESWDKAKEFRDFTGGGHIYCYTCNRRSNCGPWYL